MPAVWDPLVGHRRVTVDRVKLWVNADDEEIPDWYGEAGGCWKSPDGRLYYDAEEAQRAVDFFPFYLRHHIGEFAGDPFVLMDYQQQLLTCPLFGWKRVSDGYRRFRKVFAFLPKGAGKSPWGAGTGLYLTVCDHEPAAEVYACAGDKDQARTVHENAKIMVEESPDLSEICEVWKDAIYHPESRSTYKVISSDASTKHGFRPHGIVFDEFHAQPNRDLYEALKKSMVKRRQPMVLLISHAGHDDEGVCYEEYEYAKGVLSGRIDDESCLPVIFEASPKDDWTSPVVWARVNPGHGVTVKPDGIAIECREAMADPRKRNDFLRFHLNRWVNQATAWLPIDWWDACDQPIPPDEELRKYPGVMACDMAQKIDLSSALVAFRLPLEDPNRREDTDVVEVVGEDDAGTIRKRTFSLDFRVAVLPMFWLPEETLQDRVKQDHVPYDLWRDDGLLTQVDGAIISASPIVQWFVGPDKKSGMLHRFRRLKQGEFAYDPAFATEVAVTLRDNHGLTTIEVLQNYKHLSEACQVFEALVKAKRILHGGNRLLRWCVENVAVKTDDALRIRPVKPKTSAKRIDGVVALIMAISRLMLMPTTTRPRGVASVYTPEGFRPVGDPAPSYGPQQ
jgi:phage terminase large subunit-like protein